DRAGLQLRREREPGAVVRAEALGAARPAVLGPADGLVAGAAEPLVLRHLRVAEDGARRVDPRHLRHLDQPRAEPPAGRARAGAPRAAPRRPAAPGAGGRTAGWRRRRGGGSARGVGGGREPAGVAPPAVDGPVAARAAARPGCGHAVLPAVSSPAARSRW